jgi:uncharacterized protein YkwD
VAATAAYADPQVLSVSFTEPPVVGRATELRVQVVDPEAPVSGMVASFGPGEGGFGSSSCLSAGAGDRETGSPVSPGAPVTLASPHIYRGTGDKPGVVRVDAGGCSTITGSVFQPFSVSPAPPGAPGQNAGPLVLQPPVPVSDGSTPSLPGVEDLPPLPPLPPLPVDPPDLPDLPPPPGIPAPPPLPDLPVTARIAATSACPGARVDRSRRSRRRARRAVLCLLNRQRRMHGLRPLRHQVRLRRASLRHSVAMVKGHFFSHVQPGGVGLVTRLRRVRYLPGRAWLVGENIAWGMGGVERPLSIVRAWMHSTGHRANILQPAFREVGLGVYPGVPIGTRVRGATYTTDFGFRR